MLKKETVLTHEIVTLSRKIAKQIPRLFYSDPIPKDLNIVGWVNVKDLDEYWQLSYPRVLLTRGNSDYMWVPENKFFKDNLEWDKIDHIYLK